MDAPLDVKVSAEPELEPERQIEAGTNGKVVAVPGPGLSSR
ncbi:hypothetical protein [Arthrobacter sp. TWP1-1]